MIVLLLLLIEFDVPRLEVIESKRCLFVVTPRRVSQA
jgi:hypothetical protein